VSERTKSSSISGADFANFLHNQVQAVRNTMRPHLAASDKALPPSNSNVRNEPNAKSDPRSSDHVEANTDKADAHNNKKASAKHSSVKETQGKTQSQPIRFAKSMLMQRTSPNHRCPTSPLH
jgi:hypothetical protein